MSQICFQIPFYTNVVKESDALFSPMVRHFFQMYLQLWAHDLEISARRLKNLRIMAKIIKRQLLANYARLNLCAFFFLLFPSFSIYFCFSISLSLSLFPSLSPLPSWPVSRHVVAGCQIYQNLLKLLWYLVRRPVRNPCAKPCKCLIFRAAWWHA